MPHAGVFNRQSSILNLRSSIPTAGDWVAWVGTYEDIVKGRQGQYRVRIKDNKRGAHCAYPARELLPDGTIVTTTYGHWEAGQEPYILSVRFKMAELDKLYRAKLQGGKKP